MTLSLWSLVEEEADNGTMFSELYFMWMSLWVLLVTCAFITLTYKVGQVVSHLASDVEPSQERTPGLQSHENKAAHVYRFTAAMSINNTIVISILAAWTIFGWSECPWSW